MTKALAQGRRHRSLQRSPQNRGQGEERLTAGGQPGRPPTVTTEEHGHVLSASCGHAGSTLDLPHTSSHLTHTTRKGDGLHFLLMRKARLREVKQFR